MSLHRLKVTFPLVALLALQLACDPRSEGAGLRSTPPEVQAPTLDPATPAPAAPPIKLDQPVVTVASEDHWAQVEVDGRATFEWTVDGGRITSGWSANVVRFVAGDAGRIVLKCKIKDSTGQEVTTMAQQQVVPLPTLGTFEAVPAVISEGGGALLRWEVRDAAQLTLEPGGQDLQRRVDLQVLPTKTTTYVLTATNLAGNQVERSLQLKVVPLPVIRSFTGDATTRAGQPMTLKAEFGAGKAEIRQGTTVLASAAEGPLKVQVNPVAGTVYTLVVTNEAGTASTSTLSIANQPPPK